MAVILIVEDQPATPSIVALTGDMRPDTLLRAEAVPPRELSGPPSPQEVLPSNR